MLSGHSTVDALRILHTELQTQLLSYESKMRYLPLSHFLRSSFLHHSNIYSVLHWSSAAVVIIAALLLILTFTLQTYRDVWILVEAFVLLSVVVINIVVLFWDDRLRRTEHVQKARDALQQLQGCVQENTWKASNYIDLNSPLSQCVSLQWTIRDSCVINLPCSLLVEGDVILLRPGQTIPVNCSRLKTGDDDFDSAGGLMAYVSGDLYNPAQFLPEPPYVLRVEPRQPLKPQPYLVQETPIVHNFSQFLQESQSRPCGMLDTERHIAYNVWIERRIMPTVFILMLLINSLRYTFLHSHVGDWPELIISLQIQVLIPLMSLVFPIIWRLADSCGTAKIVLVYQEFVKEYSQRKHHTLSEESFHPSETSDMSTSIDTEFFWKPLYILFKEIWTGRSHTLPRTANLVQALGNMTSFCCVDKKGVLSWPNPTAEKVFILTPPAAVAQRSCNISNGGKSGGDKKRCPSDESGTEGGGGGDSHPSVADTRTVRTSVESKHCDDRSFPLEVGFQVLNLTQDTKDQFSLHFDDPLWKNYLASLKPLGLNILLNTCNMQTADRYTEFADHVTCASLKRLDAVPVVNKRCFCELSRQIGFVDAAVDIFDTLQILGMYRHIPPESDHLTSRKSFLKYQTPMPNMFSVIVRDITTDTRHLFSQGMADMVLDACSDFWDGHDLRPLTDAERKKIADFYHRTSMSSYCTAFAYRPMTEVMEPDELMIDLYLEVPEEITAYSARVYGSAGRRQTSAHTGPRYHGSADPLISSDHHGSPNSEDDPLSSYRRGGVGSFPSGEPADVREGLTSAQHCFTVQCNQIFIGMITMQYQAKQEMVDLIDSLESACIRFVHFSKENELRSRVFSEKMGLEAGWNCHISLLGEKTTTINTDNCTEYVKVVIESDDLLQQHKQQQQQRQQQQEGVLMERHSLGVGRSYSAPISLIPRPQSQFTVAAVVKSPSQSDVAELAQDLPRRPLSYTAPRWSHEYTSDDADDAIAPLLTRQRSENSEQRRRHPSDQSSSSSPPRRRTSSTGSSGVHGILMHRLRKQSAGTGAGGGGRSSSGGGGVMEVRSSNGGDVELDKEGGVSMASSYSDIMNDGLGSNRAKLPKGVENIRHHIDNVDNVPLQVSLFTDCTPRTTREMLRILQDYGEVICCYGSAENIGNTGIYLQADCSLSIQPLYPQICVRHRVVEMSSPPPPLSLQSLPPPSPSSRPLLPMELSALLHSLPCSFTLSAQDYVTIVRLIAFARHHCKRVRSVAALYICCQLAVTLLQFTNSLVLLPPALSPHSVLWLSMFIIPVLSLTLMFSPLNLQITKMAQGKRMQQFNKQTLLEEFLYFIIRFVPTIFVCLLCHAMNLYVFCNQRIQTSTYVYNNNENHNSSNISGSSDAAHCHLLFGYIDDDKRLNSSLMWNGWYDTERSSGLVLSQQIVAFMLVLSFSSYMDIIDEITDYSLGCYSAIPGWTKTITAQILVFLLNTTIVYFAVSVSVSNGSTTSSSSHLTVYGLADVPSMTWGIALTYPILLILIQELVKRRVIKMWVRHQKRARLDFGTKLGMNSPF